MNQNRLRWFRPVVPCVLIGALWGWLPEINGNDELDARQAIGGAVFGFVIGVMLDWIVHPVPPGGDPK